MSGFLVWERGVAKDGIAKLGGLRGVEDSFEIDDGVSRANGWPDDASFEMSKMFPKDLGLADSMSSDELMVTSLALKEAVAIEGDTIEWLPVKLINHKGRMAPEQYFVMNPLRVVDCVDAKASNARYNPINEQYIDECDRLVLREDAIPEGLDVLRIQFIAGGILIRKSLAEKLTKANLTGLRFTEPSSYKGPV